MKSLLQFVSLKYIALSSYILLLHVQSLVVTVSGMWSTSLLEASTV